MGRALGGQAGAECLQGALERSLSPAARSAGLRLRAPEVVPVSMGPAAAVTFGYREAVEATPVAAGGHPLTAYTDLVGFVRGRRLVQLQAVSARQLFPQPAERRLVADLAGPSRHHQ